MNFRDYQERAKEFAVYENDCYPFIGLAEEVGEFVSFAAKMARGDDMSKRYATEHDLRMAILKEAGDVLWQLALCLEEYELDMQDAAELNLRKLRDRSNRGVLRGYGDDR